MTVPVRKVTAAVVIAALGSASAVGLAASAEPTDVDALASAPTGADDVTPLAPGVADETVPSADAADATDPDATDPVGSGADAGGAPVAEPAGVGHQGAGDQVAGAGTDAAPSPDAVSVDAPTDPAQVGVPQTMAGSTGAQPATAVVPPATPAPQPATSEPAAAPVTTPAAPRPAAVAPGAPAAVRGLSAKVSSSGVSLTWTKNTEKDLDAYRVLRSTSPDGPSVVLSSRRTSASWTDRTAPVGVTVYYTVLAINDAGTLSAPTALAVLRPDTTAPKTPGNLRAVAVDGGVQVTWTAVTDADLAGYRVTRTVGNGSATPIGTVAPGTTRLVDALGATDGSKVTYRVAAVDAAGNRSKEASVSIASPDTQAPAPATGLQVALDDDDVVLRWTKSPATDLDGYLVVRVTDAGEQVLTSSPTSRTSYTDKGLAAGSATYRVVAVDDAGNRSTAAQASVTLPDRTPPAAPRGVTGVLGEAGIRLTWDAVADADLTGYRVTRATSSSGTQTTLATLDAGTTSFTDPAVGAAGTQHYRVVAIDASGNAAASGAVAVAIPGTSSVPGVTNLRATPSSSSVKVSWSKASVKDVKGYQVLRGTSADGPFTDLTGSKLATSSWTDKGAPAGTPLVYRVVTVLKNGEASLPVTVTTQRPDTTAPAAPRGVVAAVDGGTIRVSWQTGTEADLAGYRLERSVGSASYTTVATLDAAATGHVDLFSTPAGGTVTYRLTALDASGNASATASAEVALPDVQAPAAVTGLKASVSASEVKLSWSKSTATDLAGYLVQRAVAGTGEFTALRATPGTSTSQSDRTGVAGLRYTYRVVAVDRGGNQSPVAELTTGRTDSTAPARPTAFAAVSATGGVTLDWADSPEADLAVYTLSRSTSATSGFAVLSTGLTTSDYVDASAVEGVTYYYRVTASDLSGNVSGYTTTTGTRADVTAPDAPASLSATAGKDGVTLVWTTSPATDLAGYRIQRVTDDATTLLTSSPVTGTRYTDTSAPELVESRYLVTAVDRAGNESPAAVAVATRPDTTAPAVPTALVATASGDGIALDWADVEDTRLAGYLVHRTSGSDTEVLLTAAPVGGSAFVDADAPQGVRSTYRVVAVDTAGNASAATTASATRPDTTAPAPVPGLAALASAEGIALTWSAPADRDVTGYRVLVAAQADGAWTELARPGEPRHLDTAAAEGVTTRYRVVAVDASGNESAPVAVEATRPDTTAPAAPVGLVATATPAGITVTWDPTADTVGYLVSRWSADQGAFLPLTADPVTSPTFEDAGAVEGVVSRYAVVAVDAAGNRSVAGEVSARRPDVTAPALPGGLTVAPGEAHVALDWADGTDGDLAGYRVQRAAAPDAEFTTVAELWTESSYLDGTAPVDADSLYRVAAVDTSGNVSSYTAAAAGRPTGPVDATAPAAPSGTSHTLTRSTVELSWTAVEDRDVAGYRVYRTAPGGTPELVSGATTLTATGFSDPVAPLGVRHAYTVTAVDAAGNESPASAPTSAVRYLFDVVVDAAGSGDATTVQGGIDLIANAKDYTAARKSILVLPGLYREAVTSGSRYGINLIGATPDAADAVVTQGTKNVATFSNSGKEWSVEGLTFQHTGDITLPGNDAAVRTNQDRVVLRNVRILGGKQAVQATSPAVGALARLYVVDSVVEGASDTLIGRGTAVFERVDFTLRGSTVDFTDGSHADSLAYGFLVTGSRIATQHTGSTAYLGRAYYDGGTQPTTSSQVTIRETELGAGFRASGSWRDYTATGQPTNTWSTERFAEFRNSGPGAAVNDTRPQLTVEQAHDATTWDYLRGPDGWNPTGSQEPPADTVAPAVPTDLVATGTDRAVDLDWADGAEPDVAGWTVWRATGDGAFEPVTTELLTASAFRDSGVTAGTEYRYTVTATDTSGNVSSTSAAASAVPAGLALPAHDVLVDPAGTGDFTAIQAAVDAAPAGTAADPTVILVMPGTYAERVTITRSNVVLLGATPDATETVISSGRHQNEPGAVDLNATLVVKGNDVRVENLTAVNTYDETLGSNQALALSTTGDRLVFVNTRFIADQDTIKVDTTNVHRVARSYFVDSYIEGDVDFLYGRGTAVVDRSEIFASTRGSRSNNGYLTAASTASTNRYGFLITDSVVTSDAPDDTVHLGRPWRAWADDTQSADGGATFANSRGQVTIRETVLDGAIKTTSPWTGMSPNLWTDGRFSEYANTGEGAATAGDPTRPQLDAAQAADHTRWDYLAGSDGWNPTGSTEPVTDVVAPDAPAGLTVAADAVAPTVTLGWASSPAADLAGYRVYRAAAADGPFTLLTQQALTAPAFVDTSVAAGSTVHYRVTAVDTTGNESAAAAGSAGVAGVVLPAHDLLVDPAVAGAYGTVQSAVDAAPAGTEADPTVVLVAPGTYRERVQVDKPWIVLQGATGRATDVRIVDDWASAEINPQTGTAYGSTATTVRVTKNGTGIRIQDLTLENDYDETKGSSQALALHTQADKGVFRNIRLLGDQDTVLFNSREQSVVARSYVVGSYIEGDVDFIYGRGTVVIDASTIHLSTRGSATNNGYMLAPSTDRTNEYGVLITDSTVTSDAPAKSFYLGRPWMSAATALSQAVVRDTVLPAAVRDDAWASWMVSWDAARLFEYNNSGPGAAVNATRPQLSVEQASRYTRWTYLAGTDGWNPTGTTPPRTDTVAPDVVTGVTATAAENGTVSLTWAASSAADLAGYRVYRSTGSTVELTEAALRTPTELTSVGFVDTGLVPGTTYTYVVTAVDSSANASTASAAASATAVTPTIPPHDLLVDPTGANGAYTTVQAAVTAAGAGTATRPKVIAIMPGTYRETVSLENAYVTLVGATGDARDVVIEEDNGATTINPATGAAYGGSGSRTVYVKASNITMRDLTITNAFDEATGGDQTATALFTEGDRLVFDGVRILGNKNTLQVSTRSGTDPTVLGRAYFVDSYVEGDVDAVYGRGTAVLDRTEVHVTDRVSTPYVLAPRTFGAQAYGFLLTDSTVTSSKALYLGRPWNPDATFVGQALVRDTVLPATVRATPWRNSSGGLDWKTSARFAEYNNSGAGAGTAGADRPMLSAAQAAGVTKWDYLEGTDGWNPTGQAAPDAGDVEAPDAPASVVADFDESSTSSVALTWSPSQAADTKGYLVYRGFQEDGEIWSQLTPQPVTGTSFTDASAGRGLTTWYRLVAVDFVGNASAVATASVQVPVGPLDEEISVFVAGDSTAADYDLDRAPRAGWGQALPLYLDEDVTVRNFAQSGRSTKTFMAEGWLDKIWADIEPGDYLLVSFAHNDEDDDPAKFVPLGSVETPGTFQHNLQLFIDGARARGAHPVVVASVERRRFASVNGVETGPALVTHKGYPEAAIALASSQDVPVVNLTQASLARFTELGPEVTKQWFMHLPVGSPNYPDGQVDNTHFQATGAIGVARMVARGLDASGAWPAGVYTRNLDRDLPVSDLQWRP